MTSPVQLSDLDPASSADDADLALIRKNNTTDYKVTVALLRTINIAGLPNLSPTPNSPLATDLVMLARGGSNAKCQFAAVGFTVGTQMWFYMNAVPVSPSFWQIIPNTGDRLLAVKGGATFVTGGVSTATTNWQQSNATLTIDQIPAHSHAMRTRQSKSGTLQANIVSGTQETSHQNNAATKFTGGAGSTDTASTDPAGATNGHNHGNTWRPSASVGILCLKIL
jgi:hypothetical protein